MGHLSQEDLDKKLLDASRKVEMGWVYRHYKSIDQLYVIEALALLEETQEVCVIYRALYGKKIRWVRTLENFLEKIGKGSRFTKVS